MATELGSAYVRIRPDTSGFEKDTKNRLGPSLKRVAAVATGLIGAAKFKQFLSESVEGARSANKLTKITAQVIKTTGGAAKVSVAHIQKLTDALEEQSGVDGDLIQNGANLLLTFTNIQNKVGKGNDIFNQATKTVVDMSVALGQDTKSSAIQLGKALNDPIKGVTALSRVGVSFTDQQKKQIETLVKSGKTLDAQKIILKELGREFGGTAAATASEGAKLTVVWNRVKDSIGNRLIPAQNALAQSLRTNVVPVIAEMVSKHGPAIQKTLVTMATKFGELLAKVVKFIAGFDFNKVSLGFKALVAAFHEGDVTSDGFVGAMERVGVVLRKAKDYITEVAKGFSNSQKPTSDASKSANDLAASFKDLGPAIAAAGKDLPSFTDILKVSGVLLKFAADHVDELAKILPTLVIAYAALKVAQAAANVAAAFGLVLRVGELKTHRQLLKAINSDVASRNAQTLAITGNTAATTASTTAEKAGIVTRLRSGASWAAQKVAVAASTAAHVVWAGVTKGTALASQGLVAALKFSIAVVKTSTTWVYKNIASWIAHKIALVASSVATKAMTVATRALNFALAANPIGLVIVVLAALAAGIIYAYRHSETFRKIVDNTWKVISAGAKFMWERVLRPIFVLLVRTFLNVAGAIVHAAATAFGWVPGLGGKLKDAAKKFDNFRASVNKSLGDIHDRGVTVFVDAKGNIVKEVRDYSYSLAREHRNRRRATGGPVFGKGTATSDSIPALLSNGEHVWTAKEVQNVGGHQTMVAMRKKASEGKLVFLARGGAASAIQAGTRGVDTDARRYRDYLGKVAVKLAEQALSTGLIPGAPGTLSVNAGIVRRVFSSMFGWMGNQWNAAFQLISHESGFKNTAQNPTSTAYGMFQFLNSTWRTVGGYKTSDPFLQSIFGGRYIRQKYGNPIGAWRFWQGHHWYDNGGYLMPGMTMAFNGTGRPERVLPPGGRTSAPTEIHVHYHAPVYDKRSAGQAIEAFRAQFKANGGRLVS